MNWSADPGPGHEAFARWLGGFIVGCLIVLMVVRGCG